MRETCRLNDFKYSDSLFRKVFVDSFPYSIFLLRCFLLLLLR